MSSPSFFDTKIQLGDISEYWDTSNLLYILVAATVIDAIVLAAVRHAPDTFGAPVNNWYDAFGLSAVIADVLIIVLGFILAQVIYTYFFAQRMGFHAGYFLMVAAIVQILHDIAFYFGVIRPLPRGSNEMMDVFKEYSKAGWKVILADTAMMLGTGVLAMMLKEMPGHVSTTLGIFTVYAIQYLLFVRNKFTSIN